MYMFKLLSTILFFLLPATAVSGQSSARIFTYDASGNRIAVGVPASRAPEKAADSSARHETVTLSVTPKSDGTVCLSVRHPLGTPEYEARVYTSAGQLVARLGPTSDPQSTFNLSSMPPGAYVIDVGVDGSHITRKVVME